MKVNANNVLLITSSLLVPYSTVAIDAISKAVHELELNYIADCKVDQSGHGFYGAFMEPCEFRFYETTNEAVQEADACSTDVGEVVGEAVPVSWTFKMLESMDKDSFESFSSDDIPEFEDLMLWPDQCVGVEPRCRSISNFLFTDTLNKLFPDGVPEGSTHVRVDCRGDAVAVSRLAYSVADGFEKSIPTLVVWTLTVVLLAIVAIMWCCYGCCFLVCGTRKKTGTIENSPVEEREKFIKMGKPL